MFSQSKFDTFHQQQCWSSTLETWGIIEAKGPDTKKFLQGQLTCNVDDLKTNNWKWSAYCTNQGKTLSIFMLHAITNDTYWILIPKECINTTVEQLNKYSVFSKVEFTDISNEYSLLGLHGSNAQQTLAQHEPSLPLIKLAGNTFVLACKKTPEFLTNLPQLPINFWHAVLTQNKIIELSENIIEKFTPHMLSLPQLGAVNFNKGCYTGQEIIARSEYRGQVKRSLHSFTCAAEAIFQPGSDITDQHGHKAGTLLQSALTEKKECIGLAVLHEQYKGKQLLIHKVKIQIQPCHTSA